MRAPKDDDAVPHGTTQLIRSALSIFGHLAGWAVMYSLGVAVALGVFLDLPISGLGLIFVGLCSHGGYMFDRIKFRDSDLDPADLLADPPRHHFLRRQAKRLRMVMYAEWIGAGAVGMVMSPALGVVALGGVLAGYLYSGWKPKPGTQIWGGSRLKDVAGIKAPLVSCAVVGLGLMGVLGNATQRNDGMLWDVSAVSTAGWISVLGMWLIVIGDAVVCDLDDVASDAEFSTRSLPVMMGSFWAGIVAAMLMILGGVLLAFGGIENEVDRERILFSALIVASGLGILMRDRRRDWIDGRMLVVVLGVLYVG